MANEVTPIKRITITETDLTTAASTEESLDVVYVPGLFGIRAIVKDVDNFDPNTDGTLDKSKFVVGDVVSDVTNEKAWKCKSVEGEGQEREVKFVEIAYVAPAVDPADDYSEFTMLPPQPCLSVNALAQFGYQYDNGELGNSFDYAKGIIEEGLPVLFQCGVKLTGSGSYFYSDATVEELLEAMEDEHFFDGLLDHNEADVKYITTGAHPVVAKTESGNTVTYELNKDIVDNMIKLAALRGDALAILDGASEESIKENDSLYALLLDEYSTGVENGEYATAFAPCAHFATSDKSDVILPASFAYLTCYARSIRTNGSNLAIAGVTRGLVSNLSSLDIPASEKLTNAIADSWQGINDKVSVNGITYIRNYGYCIWGNRTLHDNSKESGSNGLIDSSFLSIRNMLCDLKKRLRNVAMRLLFEQNNDVLWSRFLFGVTPVLERLKSTAGIANYKIIHIPTDDKTKLKAVIKITTIKPLEQIEIGIVMVDDNVEVQ